MKRRNPLTAMAGRRCERDRRWHILCKTLKPLSFHNQHGWQKVIRAERALLSTSGYFASSVPHLLSSYPTQAIPTKSAPSPSILEDDGKGDLGQQLRKARVQASVPEPNPYETGSPNRNTPLIDQVAGWLAAGLVGWTFCPWRK